MLFGDFSKAAARIKGGDTDGLREMLENGLDPEKSRLGKSLLDVARRCKNFAAEALLWEYRAVFGLPDDVRRAWFAARAGRSDDLAGQLKAGLPPDTKDNDGRTLLVNALLEGQASTALLLLGYDVDVTTRDNDGMNAPVLAAARVPDTEVITRILARGGDVNTVDGARGDFDALTIAAERDNVAVAKVFLEHGFDVARFGPRALIAAARHIAPGVLGLLLDHGVDVNSVQRDETALMAAGRTRERDLSSGLRLIRGDWTTPEDVWLSEGVTALLQVVRLLRERGADPDFTDSSGRCALDYATKEGFAEVASAIKAFSRFDERRHLARVRDSGLPADVIAYLGTSPEPLDIRGGRHVQRVKLVAVNGIRFYQAEHAARRVKAGRKGTFEIPAVDLVEEVNDYSEIGVLSWFPDLRAFGCCDMEHQEVHVFKEVGWEQLLADPRVYFNAQWLPRKEAGILPLHEGCAPDESFKVRRRR